jgi:voltage-gated potassium channel
MKPEDEGIRHKLYVIIFEAESPWGKAFDIALLIMILASIVLVMLDSVAYYHNNYGYYLILFDWIITIFFTIEYLTRIWVVEKPRHYITSFYGIIDLLAILPVYLSLFFVGSHALTTIRALRLLRIFRIFKLGRYLIESNTLAKALQASRQKITVFMGTVLIIVVIVGSLMYVVESGQNSGFDSIPRSMYWAIVTLTTVGYGDITPATNIGQFLSAMLMILGYSIIAVPTGIVSVELSKAQMKTSELRHDACPGCGRQGHDNDAKFCKSCGTRLDPDH